MDSSHLFSLWHHCRGHRILPSILFIANAIPGPSRTVLMLYCAQLDVGNGFVIVTEMGMLLLHTLYLFEHSILLMNSDYEVISVNFYVPEQLNFKNNLPNRYSA